MTVNVQEGRSAAPWIALLCWSLCAGDPVAGAGGSGFRLIAESSLPAALERAQDVRWADSRSVYLAVSLTGTVRLPVAADHGSRFEVVTTEGGRRHGVWMTSYLGVSEKYLAAAAPIFTLGWKGTESPGADFAGLEIFEGIEDIDVFDDRLVVLGIRRGQDGTLAPQGAIAWAGSLDLSLSDLKPILYSSSGTGARPMDFCANFELGAIRFLADGSFLVVPGAEPGVFLYGPDGKLRHTWETEPLGLDARCDFDDQQRDLMSQNPLPRWAWVNRFRVVDEILPLAAGPGLVIREVTAEGTRWEVKILDRSGPPRRVELPLRSPSKLVHLHADVRGDRVVFLLYDKAILFNEGAKKEAAERPRLIVGELPGGKS